MLEPRYEKMLRDTVAESMDHVHDVVARCSLDSVPIPFERLEEKFYTNMAEVVNDILADQCSTIRVRVVRSPNTCEKLIHGIADAILHFLKPLEL